MLHREAHLSFLASLFREAEKQDHSLEYVLSDSIRLNALQWAVTSALLLKSPHLFQISAIESFLRSCYCPITGGYRSAPGQDPQIISTLFAIQLFVTLDLTIDNPAKTLQYVSSLQNTLDGSFAGDEWGEVDIRFSYAALCICTLIERKRPTLERFSSIDLEKAVSFILSCHNFDGGFGNVPGAESHSGHIFCAVASLELVQRLNGIDQEKLCWWLCERQLPSGGLNGRPEKLEDVCYTWWVLSSLSIMVSVHWIDSAKLSEFILACQDGEKGGFSDRPEDETDIFHTCFALAGLSLLKATDDFLERINPVLFVPQSIAKDILPDFGFV